MTIDELRRRAELFRSPQRKDTQLYELLADCLRACLTIDREAVIEEFNRTNNRKAYFERSTPIGNLVARLVFDSGDKNRTSSWRYGTVLDAALGEGIAPENFVAWVKSSGGLTAIFHRRFDTQTTVTVASLKLTQAITLPKDKPFSLTLKRSSNGLFEAVDIRLD